MKNLIEFDVNIVKHTQCPQPVCYNNPNCNCTENEFDYKLTTSSLISKIRSFGINPSDHTNFQVITYINHIEIGFDFIGINEERNQSIFIACNIDNTQLILSDDSLIDLIDGELI